MSVLDQLPNVAIKLSDDTLPLRWRPVHEHLLDHELAVLAGGQRDDVGLELGDNDLTLCWCSELHARLNDTGLRCSTTTMSNTQDTV